MTSALSGGQKITFLFGLPIDDGGVGDTDLALDGIKGTEAGFKFDLMVLGPDVPAADWATAFPVAEFLEADGIGVSFSFCNALVAAECLAA